MEAHTSTLITSNDRANDIESRITLSEMFPAWPDTGPKPKAPKRPDSRLLRRLHRDPAEEARRVAQYHREYEQWEHDKRRHDDVMYGREVNMKADREDRRKTTRTERRNQSEADKLAHRDREARRNTRKIDLMIAGDEDATEAYRKKQRIDRERQELRTLNTKIGRMSRINAVAFRNADVDTLQSVAECTQAMRLMSGLPPEPPPAASKQKRKRPPAYVRCEGTTHAGEQCSLHSQMSHVDAEPLRKGSSFCAYHQPDEVYAPPEGARQCAGITRMHNGRGGSRCRFTSFNPHHLAEPLRHGGAYCVRHQPVPTDAVRCRGTTKRGNQPCTVASSHPYKHAKPLRFGSPFCDHHRVRCEGLTASGARCSVTTSSEHQHADMLRAGGAYCAHHQDQQLRCEPAANE